MRSTTASTASPPGFKQRAKSSPGESPRSGGLLSCFGTALRAGGAPPLYPARAGTARAQGRTKAGARHVPKQDKTPPLRGDSSRRLKPRGDLVKILRTKQV